MLIKLKGIIINTDDESKLRAVDMALEKKAPFFGDKTNSNNKDFAKNSMGDAIIFLETYRFLKENKFKKKIFITENAQDFCKAGNKKELHENLQILADEVSLEYSINIAATINDTLTNLMDKNVKVQPVTEAVVEKVEKNVISDCPVCEIEDADVVSFFRNSPYGGLTLWKTCKNCMTSWETGEMYDE